MIWDLLKSGSDWVKKSNDRLYLSLDNSTKYCILISQLSPPTVLGGQHASQSCFLTGKHF